MSHINSLPKNILVRVLIEAAAIPAKNLSEWKTRLPLLAVCRTWTKLAVGAVFSQVYVEFSTWSHTFPIWTSNADLFISRGCVLTARRLAIEWTYKASSDYLQFIVLDILKLDRVDWEHINSLFFTEAVRTMHRPLETVLYDLPADADIAHMVQYFGRNLRNIVELDISILKRGPVGECLYNSLFAYYGRQLQVIRAGRPIAFPTACFMKKVRVLELSLDPLAALHLPCVYGETLRVLKLTMVPYNFAWHHFRYDIFVQPIVFRQLTILHLWFADMLLTDDEIEDKMALGERSCNQLVFPALRELSITGCSPDCDLLYADLPFPELDTVILSGSYNSLRHCTRLKLIWVRDLSIKMSPSYFGTPAEIYGPTNHFFTNICIGRSASLNSMSDMLILEPNYMRWVNLTKLDVASVNYATICEAIGRLPNLSKLDIGHLEFDRVTTSSLADDSLLFVSTDPMLAWGEKLTTLTICDFGLEYPLAVFVGGIQALILHMGSLTEMVVPMTAKQVAERFIDMYGDQYPHLANVSIFELNRF